MIRDRHELRPATRPLRVRLPTGRPASAAATLRTSVALACLIWAIGWPASLAMAQHSGDPGSAPPPPPGPGRLTVQLEAGPGAASVADVPIALYALAPDGTPGLTDGVTDADGRMVFTGISNDPGIIYLVGARYAEIPFGERVAFVAGETEARVAIAVSAPTDEIGDVRIEELRARIDWMGDRLVVTEVLRLTNPGQRVIQLAAGRSGPAIFRRRLPAGATDFSSGPSSLGDRLSLEDGTVRFAGPLYPGEQRVEYRYALPIDRSAPDAARRVELPVELREGTRRLVVIAGTPGIEVSGPGLVASREVTSEAGQALAAWARGALAAGQRIDLALALPASRLDPTALSIPRADTWIELDDTLLKGTVDLQLVVTPGAPVSGTPEAPLMRVAIPTGATLEGVAPDAEAMGLVPTPNGGFDVIGPIGPGEHSLGFSYRMPSRPGGVELDLRFPREVATLNVLIADTGLALDSSRLHRRRPFRNGTRNYLHREAFNVRADEVVDLAIVPIDGEGLPQQLSMGLVIAGAAAAGLFLMAPLRRSTPREEVVDADLVRVRAEREGVYTAIRDLDHDFETGKLDPEDYGEMRDELRGRAIELLRVERAKDAADATGAAKAKAAAGAQDAAKKAPATLPSTTTSTERSAETSTETSPEVSAQARSSTPPAAAVSSTLSAGPKSQPTTGRFCPSCGGRVDARWRFCSHCGGALNPGATDLDARRETNG